MVEELQTDEGSISAIRRVFFEEATEMLQSMNSQLMDLEATSPTAEGIRALCRSAHNLKGASGSASLHAFADLVHAFEEALGCLHEGAQSNRREAFEVLFAALDSLETALDEIGEHKPEPEFLDKALEQLQRWTGAQRETEPENENGDSDSGLVLGEYDRVRINGLRDEGAQIHILSLEFKSTEELREHREAAMSALAQAGSVITVAPPASAWDDPTSTTSIKVVFASERHPTETLSSVMDCVATWGAVPYDAPAAPLVEPRRREPNASLRVDVTAVDSLVDLIGELVIVESMMASGPQGTAPGGVRVYLGELSRITRELQDMGMRMRMVPLRNTFRTMRRMVRDFTQREGRRAELVLNGEDTEIDRSIVERLHDPLIHLLRNAFDHGLEDEAERVRAGKSPTGSVRLSARQQGASILVEVSDDGRGLDRRSILERAHALGLVANQGHVSDDEIFEFIFEPGFSTAKQITAMSGRGIGMDVVRRSVEAMRGSISVASQQGAGTTFRISLPITLAIIDGMLVSCGGERYILPSRSIVESVQPQRAMLATQAGRQDVLRLRGSLLPVVRLAHLFEVPDAIPEPTRGIMVVLEAATSRFALMVDQVLVQHQIVIKSIGHGLPDSRFLSGAAILPDGGVGLILNVDELLKLEEHDQRRRTLQQRAGQSQAMEVTP